MTMTAQDWLDMASVYAAGARKSAVWPYNRDRQQEAEILGDMAARCEEIARAKTAGAQDDPEAGDG